MLIHCSETAVSSKVAFVV